MWKVELGVAGVFYPHTPMCLFKGSVARQAWGRRRGEGW